MSFCTSCGTKIESDGNLCPNYGQSLAPIEQTSQPIAHGLICHNCGNPIGRTDFFSSIGRDQVICMNCGVQLKKVKSKSFVNSIAKCFCILVIISIIIAVITLLWFLP